MNSAFSPDIREIVNATHYRPAISIIMPFDPKISLKEELLHRLKFTSAKVEQEIKKDYPGEVVGVIMKRLRKIVKSIDVNTYKKSLAIYLSPIFEKIFYLDVPVEEKIIIDESFEIRDLVYAKKQEQHFIVLLVSGKGAKVFLGNAIDLVRIKFDIPESIQAYKKDLPERVANFSDPSDVKETLLKKFLLHADDALRKLLNFYSMPVFVMGTKKVVGYFKGLTKNDEKIAGYISGNYDEASEPQICAALDPFIREWQRTKTEQIYTQLEKAAGQKKLASGIQEVWTQGVRKKGSLLVVEKNYMYAGRLGKEKDILDTIEEPCPKVSCIRDAVDDIIEKVLANGGNVEFVNDGALEQYGHIALVKYF